MNGLGWRHGCVFGKDTDTQYLSPQKCVNKVGTSEFNTRVWPCDELGSYQEGDYSYLLNATCTKTKICSGINTESDHLAQHILYLLLLICKALTKEHHFSQNWQHCSKTETFIFFSYTHQLGPSLFWLAEQPGLKHFHWFHWRLLNILVNLCTHLFQFQRQQENHTATPNSNNLNTMSNTFLPSIGNL